MYFLLFISLNIDIEMCPYWAKCPYIVPREVKNQRALAKRTSKILKNGEDAIFQMGSGTTCYE